MKTINKSALIKNIIIAVLSVAVAVLLIIPLISSDDESLTRVTDRTEVERRFLVSFDDLPSWNMMGTSVDIMQSYISFTPEIRLRNVNGSEFLFTLRTPVSEGEVTRRDVEFNLSRDEYDGLFQKISGTPIHKARYRFVYDDVSVRLDIFFGHLDGLIFAEILFDSAEEADAFMPLHWFGKEITEDRAYRNVALSRDGVPESN
jgi:CYTH domain-containing protein